MTRPCPISEKLGAMARETAIRQTRALAAPHLRERALETLAPQLAGDRAGSRRVVRWLKKALRDERGKAVSGHWSYDPNRHLLLKAALCRELALAAQGAASTSTHTNENAAPGTGAAR